MTQTQPGPILHVLYSPAPAPITREVFGTAFMEVTLGNNTIQAVPGWALRLWPRARLGDATLEASPDGSLQISDLICALATQGIQVLGPVRHRTSRSE